MGSTVFKSYVILTVLCICMALVNKSQQNPVKEKTQGGCMSNLLSCITPKTDEGTNADHVTSKPESYSEPQTTTYFSTGGGHGRGEPIIPPSGPLFSQSIGAGGGHGRGEPIIPPSGPLFSQSIGGGRP